MTGLYSIPTIDFPGLLQQKYYFTFYAKDNINLPLNLADFFVFLRPMTGSYSIPTINFPGLLQHKHYYFIFYANNNRKLSLNWSVFFVSKQTFWCRMSKSTVVQLHKTVEAHFCTGKIKVMCAISKA